MTVMVLRMAASDAQMLWLSRKVPNDQFLLYAFDGVPDIEAGLADVRATAQRCPELRLRVVDDGRWRYPRWESGEISPEQFVVHPAADLQDHLNALAGLDQLDLARMAWRVHVFPPAIVVVQISHALGDGTRSAVLAGALLGRAGPVAATTAPDRGFLPWRAVVAARAHRRLLADVEAGLVSPPAQSRPALSVNAHRGATPVRRTMVLPRARLPGPTVTVGALVAVADALGGYLDARGEDITRLGAEVPMAGGGEGRAHNDFRNVSVDLHPLLRPAERSERIAAQLAAHRRRGEHPAVRASAAAFSAVPASLLRWGVGRFDPMARSDTVSGHTVVSSVNRGPADLRFGGSPVAFTAGFPALSPMIGLAHGVHGIGDTVAVSVVADPTAVDADDYIGRLADALGWQP